jgi:hypothetical protein
MEIRGMHFKGCGNVNVEKAHQTKFKNRSAGLLTFTFACVVPIVFTCSNEVVGRTTAKTAIRWHTVRGMFSQHLRDHNTAIVWNYVYGQNGASA